MLYFAYGSNMCAGWLRSRVPSATLVGIAKLTNHSLRFHKRSGRDGSGKCDAYFTGEPEHVIWGVVYEIDPKQKQELDRAEGLGDGYAETRVSVLDRDEGAQKVFMYIAERSHINPALQTFSWYKRFLVEGARQHELPTGYIEMLDRVVAAEDPDGGRD